MQHACSMNSRSSGILQVVSGEGDFNGDLVNSFMRENDVQEAGVDYQVVAITGPQSSGKSTLMNALVRYSRWCPAIAGKSCTGSA